MPLKTETASRCSMQGRSLGFAAAGGPRPRSAWKAFRTALLRAFCAWAV